MRPAALVLCAMAFLLEGCGFPSGHPTLSFPSPNSSADPGEVTTVPVTARSQIPYVTNLSGVVKAGGVALAGANVVVVANELVVGQPRSTVSDSSGHYNLPAVAVIQPMGPLISAYKPGYFTDAKWSPAYGNQAVNFDLSPLTYTQLGTVVRSRMADAQCEGVGYGRVPCHRVAIIAPATGVLEVTVSAPVLTGDLDIWGPKGASAAYFPCPCRSPFVTTLTVEKGETYEIHVTVTPEIELTAALRVS